MRPHATMGLRARTSARASSRRPARAATPRRMARNLAATVLVITALAALHLSLLSSIETFREAMAVTFARQAAEEQP